MSLLLAKITGVQMSCKRESPTALIIISVPIPFMSPQLNPIIGLFSIIVLFNLFQCLMLQGNK